MEKLKIFWESKSNQERRKIIVYAIAGVVSIALLVIVILLNTKSNEKEVADFSNPDAKEVEKFNSRSEANQMGKKDSASMNLAMDNLFGESETAPIQEESSTFYEPNYTGSSNAEYQQPSYSSSSSGGGSSSYNKHSTYGDYSMWQADEPQNSSVGYSSKNNVPAKKNNDNSNEPKYTEIPSSNSNVGYVEPKYTETNYNASNVDLSQQQQVSAQLISQGSFVNGRTLSFALKEATTIKGNKLPKNFVIQGVGSFENNRIMVRFNAIKVNNKLVPVNIALLDSNGIEGMGVAGAEKPNDGESKISNEVLSRTGAVGGVISSVISGKGSERKVELKPKQVYLVIN